MKSLVLIILVLIPIYEVRSQNKNEVSTQDASPAIPKVTSADKFSYVIFSVSEAQFGYDIYQNNKLLIHQPQIPGVSGNNGFNSKADATKVATLVIDKIKKGIFPPTVTLEEMEKLKIKIR